jgi:putative nucleotidyltransferase with HDIG domain
MISHEEAMKLLSQYLQDEKLHFHSYAVEAIMKQLAKKLSKDEELWSLIGLLHDLDFEYTQNNPEKHTKITSEILSGLIPEIGINAIQGHNYIHTDYLPTSELDKALLAADAVSGLIIATALVMPNKKLSEVKEKTLQKKYADSSFAKGCDRDRIAMCEDIGIPLEEFLQLSLIALQQIPSKLNL